VESKECAREVRGRERRKRVEAKRGILERWWWVGSVWVW
jgi:hypothetical protein